LFAPAGFVAVLMGWTTTEVGRQPWTVYGLMRTADSVTPSLSGGDVLASLLLYVIVYLIMFPAGLAYMGALVRRGIASAGEEDVRDIEAGRPKQAFRGGDAAIESHPGGTAS
jgi:cytochrome d ubiquinol oxidase subunit I